MPCNHKGEFQTCDTFHECRGCGDSIMGSFTNGYSLSCWPVAKQARAEAIGECVKQVRAMGQKWYGEAKARGATFSDKGRLAEMIATALESLKGKKTEAELEPEDPTRDPMNLWAHGIADSDFD
jgi:hypothetical protein